MPRSVVAVHTTPSRAARGALMYVGLFSMWLGFFAWYGGLAMGGIVRVSQVQLVEPFLALRFAAPVLGERLDPVTLGFALAVIGVVFVSRRLPVGQPCSPAALQPSASVSALRHPVLSVSVGLRIPASRRRPGLPGRPGRSAARAARHRRAAAPSG
ncbi:MAG: EamA family transporter [Rubrivivax sp.]